MLSWNEYIEELLSTPTVLDNMSLRNNGNAIDVSPIVKASIQMLESMIETEGRHNVLCFQKSKNYYMSLLFRKQFLMLLLERSILHMICARSSLDRS